MRNSILTTIVAMTLILYSSCNKKDYTCTCSETVNHVSTVVSAITIHDTQNNAQSQCAQDATNNYGGTGAYVSCTLN